jgi:hypothetical protein
MICAECLGVGFVGEGVKLLVVGVNPLKLRNFIAGGYAAFCPTKVNDSQDLNGRIVAFGKGGNV